MSQREFFERLLTVSGRASCDRDAYRLVCELIDEGRDVVMAGLSDPGEPVTEIIRVSGAQTEHYHYSRRGGGGSWALTAVVKGVAEGSEKCPICAGCDPAEEDAA